MNHQKQTGQRGEDLAVELLENDGYTIQERNYRFKRAEIDIIAKKRGMLVFVEVKSRKSNVFGYPESFVDDKQADRITEAAEEYMYQINWLKNVRFDIISIETGSGLKITHFKDAFH